MHNTQGFNKIWIIFIIVVAIIGTLIGVWLGLKSNTDNSNPAILNIQQSAPSDDLELDDQEYYEARARAFEEIRQDTLE